ncbi:carbohydrate ABC transporter permease [Paenibacillus sp. FSL H8-0548]|uniref:carbohydrate ABC transporter permease n=2 Tax=Paenibacillus sp. FSL H8-0548 TaxID=1920422 RepID=UPI0009FA4276|nr:carbohydrate ABC transporter permease [Paenibacillus sp. FSL H8-0548]
MNEVMQKKGIVDVLILIFLLLLSVTTLYPILNLLFVSLSSMDEVVKSNGMMLYPKSINLDGYRYIFRHAGLSDAYMMTIFITVVGTAINLIMTTLGAYVLSVKDMPGRNPLMMFVLVTMFFSGGLIPSYLVIKGLGMVNTVWALLLPGAISAWLLILMRNFFQSIPKELRESAKIDGSSEYGVLWRIMLPLSLPIMATLALFYGVGHWNEYINVIIYINDEKLSTLQVLLRRMYTSGAISEIDGDALPPPVETVRAATVILTSLPIISVYPFLQRYFVQGMIVGAVKG